MNILMVEYFRQRIVFCKKRFFRISIEHWQRRKKLKGDVTSILQVHKRFMQPFDQIPEAATGGVL